MSIGTSIKNFFKDSGNLVNIALIFAIMLPILYPVTFPTPISPETQDAYDFIDSIPDGSSIIYIVHMEAYSWGASAPQIIATLEHISSKNLKAIFVPSAVQAPMLTEKAMSLIVGGMATMGEYGSDYVILGYIPVVFEITISSVMEDLFEVYTKDYYGNDLTELSLVTDLQKGKNAVAVLASVGVTTLEEIIRQVSEEVPVVITSLGASQLSLAMAYYEAGTLKGIVPPGKGGAEYEVLNQQPGLGIKQNSALSFPNLLLVCIIILTNVIPKFTKKRGV